MQPKVVGAIVAAVLVSAVLFVSCSGGDSADDPADTSSSTTAGSGDETTSSTADTGSSTTQPESTTTTSGFEGASLITTESQISTSGLGLIRTGQTQAEAESAANDAMIRQEGGTDACYTTVLERSPGAITILLSNGEVGSVIVDDQSVATRSGARVGDSEQQILELFGANIEVSAIPTGNNLTFVPSDEEFQNDRVVFRTDGELVVQIRSGRLPDVGAENGCSDLG